MLGLCRRAESTILPPLDLHQNPFVRVKKTVEKLGRKLILNHHREKAVGLFVFVGKDIVGLLPQLLFQHD